MKYTNETNKLQQTFHNALLYSNVQASFNVIFQNSKSEYKENYQ